MQKYIHCQNPSPDEDTMLTLIETNDQLAMAMSKHQRALLQAKKEISRENSMSTTPQPSYSPPAGPPPSQLQTTALAAPQAVPHAPEVDPFADSHAHEGTAPGSESLNGNSYVAYNPDTRPVDTPVNYAEDYSSHDAGRERGYSDAYDPPTPDRARRRGPDTFATPSGLGQHPVSTNNPDDYAEAAYRGQAPVAPAATTHSPGGEVSPPSSPPTRKPVVSKKPLWEKSLDVILGGLMYTNNAGGGRGGSFTRTA
jgi:hypothetical protein